MLKKFSLIIFMGLDLVPALSAELDTGGERFGKILGRNVRGLIDSEDDVYDHSGNQNYNENSNTIRRPPIRIASFRDREKIKLPIDGGSIIKNSKRRPKNPVGNLIEVDLVNEDKKGVADGDSIPVEIISSDNPGLVKKSPRKKPRKKSSRIKGSGLKTEETVPKITSVSGESPSPVVITKIKKPRSEKERKKGKKIRTGKKERYQIKDPGDIEADKLPDLLEFYKNYMETEPTEQSMVNVNVNTNRNEMSLEDDGVYELGKEDNRPSILSLAPEEGGLESPIVLGEGSPETGVGNEVTEVGKGRNSDALIELTRSTIGDALQDLKESNEHRAKTKPVSEENSTLYEASPEDEESASTPVEYVQKIEKKLEPPEPEVVVVPVEITKPKVLAYKPKVKKNDENPRPSKGEIQKLITLLEQPRVAEAERNVPDLLETTIPGNISVDYVDPILGAFKILPRLKTVSRVNSRVESSSAYHYTMGDSKIVNPAIEYIDDYETVPDPKYLTDHTGMDNVLAEIMRYIFGLRPASGRVVAVPRRHRKLVAPGKELRQQPYSEEDYTFE